MNKNTYEKIDGGFGEAPAQAKRPEPVNFPMGATANNLLSVVKDWPELDREGDPTECWMETSSGNSALVRHISFAGEPTYYGAGLTVRELKCLLKDWEGKPGEIQIGHAEDALVRINNLWPLNVRELDEGGYTADIDFNVQ